MIVCGFLYQDDYDGVVERILLDVGSKHTREIVDAARPALQRMREKYFLSDEPAIDPRVYVRMTDNWVECRCASSAAIAVCTGWSMR